jgi:arabinose-5-phosphate isomerase
MGDALAVALLDARGFREEDFARSHPGGALGRRLLTYVRDVMRIGSEIPAMCYCQQHYWKSRAREWR